MPNDTTPNDKKGKDETPRPSDKTTKDKTLPKIWTYSKSLKNLNLRQNLK